MVFIWNYTFIKKTLELKKFNSKVFIYSVVFAESMESVELDESEELEELVLPEELEELEELVLPEELEDSSFSSSSCFFFSSNILSYHES